MQLPRSRARAVVRTLLALAALALLAPRPSAAPPGACPNAYFEMQPPPEALPQRGWRVPAAGDWTEVWPVHGAQHPQYAFADQNLDGLISHAESFIEAPAGAPWYIAGVGTMYHLTPIEFPVEGDIVPIGDPVTAWSDQFWFVTEIRSDGRPWFICPDTLVFLHPDCCERRAVATTIAGGVVGNGPPMLFAFEGPAGGEWQWYFRDSLTCGLWVAPDLATGATRRSWGSLKAIVPRP